jgi:hypothetical protein
MRAIFTYKTKIKQLRRILLMALLLFLFAQPLLAQSPISKIWDRTYGGSNSEELISLIRTADGGYLLGGSSKSGAGKDKSEASRGDGDFWVVKLNANGSKAWDKTFGGSGSDWVNDMIMTPDGGYLVGGSSDSGAGGDKTEPSRGDTDYWLIKLDANGSKVWDKTIGGDDTELFGYVTISADGSILLAGDSFSGAGGDKTEASRGGFDFWLVKLNANGSKAWDKTFGGSAWDHLNSFITTEDGGYLLGGIYDSDPNDEKTEESRGNTDYWIIKLNANGSKAWDRTFGGGDIDVLTSMLRTADGGYLLGGYSYSGIGGDKTEASRKKEEDWWLRIADYWAIKLNDDGSKAWDKTLGGSGNDVLMSVLVTTDGGYLLGGRSHSGADADKTEVSRGESDYWLVKLNANGSKMWDKAFGGNEWDEFTSLITTTDGGYLLGGSSDSGVGNEKTEIPRGESDYWIVKIREKGPLSASEMEEASGVQVLVYPNPIQDNINIVVNGLKAHAEKLQVSLYNSLGQSMLHQVFDIHQVQSGIKLSSVGLASGVYHLQLQIGEKFLTKKMMKN